MNKVCPDCCLPLNDGATSCDQCGTSVEGAVLLKTSTNSGRARIPVLAFLTLAAVNHASQRGKITYEVVYRSRQSAISGNPVLRIRMGLSASEKSKHTIRNASLVRRRNAAVATLRNAFQPTAGAAADLLRTGPEPYTTLILKKRVIRLAY
jgi:hypothetical protein